MTEVIPCKKHPTYRPIHGQPRRMCSGCWQMWDQAALRMAEEDAERKRIEAEENEVSTLTYTRLADRELRELAWNIVHERVFTSRHCRSCEEALMVFPVLQMMKRCDQKYVVEHPPGFVWEFYKEAAPRGVNGLPMFFSARFLSPEDLPIVEGYMREMMKERAKWVDVDQLGPDVD